MARPVLVLAVLSAFLVLQVVGNTQPEKDTETGGVLEDEDGPPLKLDSLLELVRQRELKLLKQLEKGMDKLPEADRIALQNRLAQIEKFGEQPPKSNFKVPITYKSEYNQADNQL